MPLKDLPTESRPREKLLTRGPQALSDAELLAALDTNCRAAEDNQNDSATR